MRSRLPLARLVFMVLMLVAASATSARAQGWGRAWFEQWSGQGSFTGYDVSLTLVCETAGGRFVSLANGRGDRGPGVTYDQQNDTRWCLDFVFGDYENLEDDRPVNGEITFKKYQVVAMASPFASGVFELGAGAGFTAFEGENPDFEFKRFHIPTRMAFKPLRWGQRDRGSNDGWRGIVQLVGNLHVFPRPLTDKDTLFRQHEYQHHFQGNLMLFFDFSALLFQR